MDLAWHKVRVNAVCPGNIDTKMLGPGQGNPEVRKLLARGHALGRVGEPEEIAHAVACLASDDAAFITATSLSVDGGPVGGMDHRGVGRSRSKQSGCRFGCRSTR